MHQSWAGRKGTPWGAIASVWLLLAVLLTIASLPAIAQMRFPDPDDSLRLTQVRDLLAGQGWFDLRQHRIDPAGGSPVMHWSRLVDLPLLLVIFTLTPFFGQQAAELAAVVVVPLLALGVAMAVIGAMASRLFDRRVAILACVACAFSPVMLFQFQPLRIDHHGWQVVALAVAVAALMHRRPWTGGAIAGVAMATGLTISLELLPLATAIAGVLLLRWLRGRGLRGWLTGFLLALAAGLAVLFLLTRGPADLVMYCDAISSAHLAFFGVVASAATGLALRPRLSPVAVVAILSVAGVAGLALFASMAPQCLAGPFGNLDPVVREYWYINVLEGRPFWIQRPERALPVVAQGFVALSVVLHLWRRSAGAPRNWWLDYALLLGAALAGGMLVWRSMAFAGVLSALPLGWLAAHLLARFRTAERQAQRLGAALLAVVVLVPSSPVGLVRLALPAPADATVRKVAESSCDLRLNLRRLDTFPSATVFAPIDIGPAILERTHHSVVATSHHRAERSMRDVIVAFTGPERESHSIISRHRAEYLIVCTDLVEPAVYSQRHSEGLMSTLLRGEAPTWLDEVPMSGSPGPLRVWRVVR